MRKALIIGSIPFLTLLLGALMVLGSTPSTQDTPDALSGVIPTGAMSTPTYDLPLCESEDGSGQMLCMWDATFNGDGTGQTVIAGDCSVGTVGTPEISQVCVKTWQGINGPEHVDECLTIAWEIENGERTRESGWTLKECLSAMAH